MLLALLGHGERAGGIDPTPALPRPTTSASPEPEFPVWETCYITSDSSPRPKQTYWTDWEGWGSRISELETEIPSTNTYIRNENTVKHRQARQAPTQDSGSDMGEP